jgi:hypothetical protein
MVCITGARGGSGEFGALGRVDVNGSADDVFSFIGVQRAA